MSAKESPARFWIALGVWLVAAVAVSTPLVPFAWRPGPLVLGLPPAILWVCFWLVIAFVLVLALYRTEPEAESDLDDPSRDSSGPEAG